jgi:geranylgeranyl diphosphate synthase type I
MTLPAPFHRYRTELEEELKAAVGDSPLPLYMMMRYHLGWVNQEGYPQPGKGGKALRPTLCLLACEAVGGDWRKALPAAAALELVHNFSLIHDDIEDRSPERRHRPTVWWLWGEAQAINVGDAMHSLARLSLLRLEQRGVSPEKILQASRILDETCLRLCEGQYRDISYEQRLDIDLEDYLEMIAGKTAQLFETSLHLGALLGTEDNQLIQPLCLFGRKLGLAFQMWDDFLGIWGKEEITGKPVQSDIQQRKKTLPVVYALGKADFADREKLRQLYSKDALEDEEISLVRQLLEKANAQSYTEKLLEDYYFQALQELKSAPLSPAAGEELAEVAAFLLERKH